MSKDRLEKAIGYCCFYTPVEILHSFGLEPRYCIGGPSAPDISQAYLNPNICGFVRAVASRPRSDVHDMVFTDSCDAMMKLYEAWNLHSDFENDFSYLLPVPRLVDERAIEFWQNALQHLIATLEEVTGRKFSEANLVRSIKNYNLLRHGLRQAEELLLVNKLWGSAYAELLTNVQRQDLAGAIKTTTSFLEARSDAEEKQTEYRLLISGSNFPAVLPLASLLEENECNAVFFDTCNMSRSYNMVVDESLPPLEAIARGYLQKTPCPRMKHSADRFDHLINIVRNNNIDGVIYHILKFCDPHIFDHLVLKKHLDQEGIPLLRVETEHEFSLPGQIRTRVEAFVEML